MYLIVRVGISRIARTLDFLAGIRSAGVKLWTKMNAALKATGVAGAEFDEYELEALDAACAAADRAEQLQRVYDAELTSDDPRPTTLARLSAEIRHCERQSLQMLERVQLTPAGEVAAPSACGAYSLGSAGPGESAGGRGAKHTGRALHLGRTRRIASADQRIVLLALNQCCTTPC